MINPRRQNNVAKVEAEMVKEVPLNVVGDPILAPCKIFVDAVYRNSKQELPEYGHNALVLALPRFDRAAILDGMREEFAVCHSELSRRWTMEQRMLGLNRISRVWVLLPVHVQLLDWAYAALRTRYLGLQCTEVVKREMQQRYEAIQSGEYRPLSHSSESHSECKSIFALSGVGKTTAMKIVLSTLPMIIKHKQFEGADLRVVQAVWVFVSCPHNGSVTTLLRGILRWFDNFLDTRYVEEMSSRSNTGDWIDKVILVLSKHFTGILVIDEIQNALKAANRHEMIDFLTTMFNARCCAFVCLGTPDAEKQMPLMRTRRRVSSSGLLEMTPFELGPEWTLFAAALTAVDFQRKKFEEPDVIYETLFILSAGMPAIAKLVWRMTEYCGIVNEDSEEKNELTKGMVTPELMEAAAASGLGLVEGMLAAIRQRDFKAIAELTGMAEKRVGAYLTQPIPDKEARQALSASEMRVRKTATIAGYLVNLGLSDIDAQQYARQVMIEAASLSVEEAVRRVILLFEGSKTHEVTVPPAFDVASMAKPPGKAAKRSSKKPASGQAYKDGLIEAGKLHRSSGK
ncbi:AAA domain-containing protein [Burkholderia sp. D7]|nr:AAA domain-containing protein [Burkholderia sp. D7]